ncbi:MAG: HIT family protein [Jatrophihabitans sp.]|uniref:HIT family protein n=1 Tax=Jatrophihabitans sp. TaxID=1932789 RepID=UPI003F8038A4
MAAARIPETLYGAMMDSTALASDCLPCEQEAAGALPPREDILHTDHWRVVHAFNSTLPGWLVVLPTRHVTSLADLTLEAATELGPLIRRLSLALRKVRGCEKTYLMQFSEAVGFAHLHLHLVPVSADHPDEARGPAVFRYLTQNEEQWLSETERDSLALALRAYVR